jgi:hypothetical protein
VRRVAGIAAVYALLTLVFTRPLVTHLRTHVPMPSHPTTQDDTLLLGWVLSWDVHQLLHAPLRLWEANVFHPLRHTLAYSEAMLSEALLVLPLAPLTPDPTLLYNVTLLSTFVLGAIGTYLLVGHLTRSAPAAFVAGLLFAFAPYRMWQIDRLNALCVHLTPFLFLALHRWLERGGWPRAVLLAVAFFLQALTSVYVAYASAILVALWLAAAWRPGNADVRRGVLGAVAALALASVAVFVVYAPYGVVRDEMALARDPGQLVLHAVMPAELGRAVVGLPRYLEAKLVSGFHGGGTLGLTATLLAVLGVLRGGRSARLYALLALVALVLSFGPVVVLPWGGWVRGPYGWLYDWVPGFTAMREPRRLSGFVVACGSVVAGLGMAAWLRGVWSRRGVAVRVGVVCALVALEVGWRPLPLAPAPLPGPRRALYDALAGERRGAVVELPVGGPRDDAVATFRSAYHLRPLVNGYSGFRPTGAELRRRARGFPRRASVRWLERLGVRFVVYDTRRAGARDEAVLRRRLARAAPDAAVHAVADGVALVELRPLPTLRARFPGAPISRAGWRASASGGDAGAAIDGDLATHWTSAVDARSGGGWIAVDFGAERDVGTIRLELAAHYGEYPRRWRVLAWSDGKPWVVAERAFAEAPLVSYRADHGRVTLLLPLPPTRARGIRVEVPPLIQPGRKPPFDLAMDYWGWRRWGVHELAAFAPSRSLAGPDAEPDGAALDGEAEVRIEQHVEPARQVRDAHVGREAVR